VSGTVFENPFRAPGRWWKGNLHTHTTVSDGVLPPAEAAGRYRALGYDFLAITDHGILVEPFEAPEGLLVVRGIEHALICDEPPRVWHVVSLEPTREAAPEGRSLGRFIADIRDSSSFWFLSHPYWSSLSEEDLLTIDGLTAVEVFNTICERIVGRGHSEQAWDYALACGRRLNALAVDDAHAECDYGRGWIMLRAETLDLETLLDALRRGLYYASCGPEITDLTIEGGVVSVHCSPCRSITFMAASPRGRRVAAPEGELLESAQYEIKGTETYVRVQVEDAEGRRAYANPVYLEDDVEGNTP